MIEGRNPITPQELRHIAQGIHIGDTIEWRVPDASFDREKGSSRRRRLKVVRKSRHLLEAEDKNGRVHSIRYAEIAMKNREEWSKRNCKNPCSGFRWRNSYRKTSTVF